MSNPVGELAERLAGRIGDFAGYRALIREIGERRLVEGAPLLATIVARNAAFEATSSGFEDVTLALEALAALGERSAAPQIRRFLATLHLSERAREAAIAYLAAAGDRSAAPVIARFLAQGGPRLRGAAVYALGRLGAAAQADALAERLADTAPPVARAAALALARLGDRRGRAVLEAELARRPAPDLVEALAAIGDADSGVRIARLAGHPDPARRRAVAETLADLDPDRFRRVLSRLADDPDTTVRAAAAEAPPDEPRGPSGG